MKWYLKCVQILATWYSWFVLSEAFSNFVFCSEAGSCNLHANNTSLLPSQHLYNFYTHHFLQTSTKRHWSPAGWRMRDWKGLAANSGNASATAKGRRILCDSNCKHCLWHPVTPSSFDWFISWPQNTENRQFQQSQTWLYVRRCLQKKKQNMFSENSIWSENPARLCLCKDLSK